MIRKRGSLFVKVTLMMAAVILLMSQSGLAAMSGKATTRIAHEPVTYCTAGKRIVMHSVVSDPHSVKLVRCYFKALHTADYLFIDMQEMGDNTFRGILPAPTKQARTMAYLFLAVNGLSHVVRSQVFQTRIDVTPKASPWQPEAVQGDSIIQVRTELEQAPQEVEGFSDNLTTDVAESSARFGALVGLYGETSRTAAISSMIGVSDRGIAEVQKSASNRAVIGTTAAVLIGAGLAVALGNDGGGDEVPAGPSGPSQPSSTQTTSSSPVTSPTAPPPSGPLPPGDYTPPNVRFTVPAPGSSVLCSGATVSFHFSEAMDQSMGIITSDIGCWNIVGQPWIDESRISVGWLNTVACCNTVILLPAPEVTFELSGFRDMAGNYLSGQNRYTYVPF